MQDISIRIDNQLLEKRLLDEAQKKGKKLANLILEVLENNFLENKESKYKYKKLDPLKHMSKIDYKINEDEDLSDVSPFEDVEDSAAYVRNIRVNTWRG